MPWDQLVDELGQPQHALKENVKLVVLDGVSPNVASSGVVIAYTVASE